MNILSIFSRLLGALSQLVGPFAGFMWGKNSDRRKRAEDAARRAEKGRQGAADAKGDLAKGKTPDEIVRENDENWN